MNKDQTNISYYAGNDTTATKGGNVTPLIVRVFDIDAGTSSLSPAAIVNFKLLHSGYSGGEKSLGSNTTNSTGYVEFDLNISDCTYQSGSQYWAAEINSSESNYNISKSINYTINVVLALCNATVDVYPPILVPSEAFQNRTFAVNATLTSWVANATNVTASINASTSWEVSDRNQYFASVAISSYIPVSWRINATSYGSYILNVTANSSNAGSDSLLSSSFTVYKVSTRVIRGRRVPCIYRHWQ